MDQVRDTTHGYRAAHSRWHNQLDGCGDVDSILSVTRDYLATFGPERLARLPSECRPGRIKGEDDIAYWSCKLAQHPDEDLDVPIDATLMQELLNYFLHAWVRISQIQRAHSNAIAPQYH